MATFLVTGANRGIGLEFCRKLKERGDNVIATCRSTSKELDGIGVCVKQHVDLTSSKSVAKLIEKLEGMNINGLILNAGILEKNDFLDLDPDSIRKQFEVNALSPLCFTRAISNHLCEGSKVIFITSRMGSIADNASGGSYGYRMSKVALCMAGKSLAIDLKARGIAVALLHPGLVSTRMTRFTPNGITAAQSVTSLIERINELNLENSGSFWHANGEILPW